MYTKKKVGQDMCRFVPGLAPWGSNRSQVRNVNMGLRLKVRTIDLEAVSVSRHKNFMMMWWQIHEVNGKNKYIYNIYIYTNLNDINEFNDIMFFCCMVLATMFFGTVSSLKKCVAGWCGTWGSVPLVVEGRGWNTAQFIRWFLHKPWHKDPY